MGQILQPSRRPLQPLELQPKPQGLPPGRPPKPQPGLPDHYGQLQKLQKNRYGPKVPNNHYGQPPKPHINHYGPRVLKYHYGPQDQPQHQLQQHQEPEDQHLKLQNQPKVTKLTTPKNQKRFGPNKEKVPTPIYENRMAIIIAYTASILLLLIFILIVLCMLMRYHKRPPSEVSSDTASSDFPMLKPDAKRYQPGIIRRQNSESPPPLPDLNLFDEPPKYSDLSRGGRSGSLRKSKLDLKRETPPNWL